MAREFRRKSDSATAFNAVELLAAELEGHPVVRLGVLGSGEPVIVTSIVGTGDLVEGDQARWLVPHEAPVMAEALVGAVRVQAPPGPGRGGTTSRRD